MKAFEFVKKVGWDWKVNYADYCVNINDLKTLVEAKELVDSGLPELKKAMFSESKDLDYVKNWIVTVSEKLLTEKGVKLKQAIKLIEIIEGVSLVESVGNDQARD